MEHKYRITVEEIATGRTFENPVECDGLLIVGVQGSGERYEKMITRAHKMTDDDIAAALYTEPRLRRAALEAAWQTKHQYKGFWWKLFHRRPK